MRDSCCESAQDNRDGKACGRDAQPGLPLDRASCDDARDQRDELQPGEEEPTDGVVHPRVSLHKHADKEGDDDRDKDSRNTCPQTN